MVAETTTPTIRRISSIRVHLVIGFAVIVGLTIISVLVTNNALQTLEAQTKQVIETTVRVKELSQEIETDFLLARQAEAEFMQSWRELGFDMAETAYVVTNQSYIAEARRKLDALDALVSLDSETVPDHLREDVATLRPKLTEYESTFANTVASIRARSRADGYEDRLDRAIDTLEISIRDLPNPEFLEIAYRLRNNQLAYANTGEQQYIDNTRLLVDRFLVLVATTDAADFGVVPSRSLERQVNGYQEAFNNIVQLDQSIATNAAIFREITADINTLNIHINAESTEAREAAAGNLQENVARLTTLATLIGVVTIAVGVLTAVFLTQRIVVPLATLTESAQKISQGEFDVTADVQRRDEFGVLAQAFNSMIVQLRALIAGLEKRVADRTRDLELAAEVGQSLAAVRDLDALLTEATEHIRDRFDLYYTQIYLTDANERNLILRAGTGDAGQELIRRGHRLPLEARSINGSAAARRQPIIVADTEHSPLFQRNDLLPLTRSEMAVPLIAVGRVVGVLDLQSDRAHTFTEENLPAFMSLAGQLAVAIDNAQLFEETKRAQLALQAQAQQMTQGAWQAYLDAIQRGEWLGYTFDAQTLTEIHEPVARGGASTTAVNVPIVVSGEEIGLIQLEQHPNQQWSDDQQELIATISQQISQQVENLRLLAETDRYRTEAEQAARRLIRDAWDDYLAKEEALAPAYLYDHKQVQPISDTTAVAAMSLQQPLIIGGETIGYLELNETESNPNAVQQLLISVTQQLSAHIENLRLSEETANALAETQKRGAELALINRIVSTLSASLDLNVNMNTIAVELSHALNADEVGITLLDVEANVLRLIAVHNLTEDRTPFIGLEIPLENNPASQYVINSQKPLIIDDVINDPRGAPVKEQMELGGFTTLAILPIVLGSETIGTVGLSLKDAQRRFTEEEIDLAHTVMLQATTAVQNARLFSQTEAALAEAERRSQEMAAVNAIAQIAAQQFDSERLFEAVYEQIRQVVPVDTFHIALYDPATNLVSYPIMYEMGKRVSLDAHPQDADSFTTQVMRDGRPVLENFTTDEIDQHRQQKSLLVIGESEDLITASVMFAPLRIGNQMNGIISVQSYQLNAYNEDNLSLLSSVANYTSVALQNHRLFGETQDRARRERILREVTTRVNAAVDAESMLRTAAQEVSRALGLEATIYLDDTLLMPDGTGTNGHK